MIATARISSKHQITIPTRIFESLQLKEGDTLNFLTNENGSVTISSAQRQLEEIIGSFPPLPKKYRGMTEDELISVATDNYFKEKYGK